MNERVIALDSKVLAVSTERIDGWCAYIGAVPGRSHEVEWGEVLRIGCKLSEHVAVAIFGKREDMPYAR